MVSPPLFWASEVPTHTISTIRSWKPHVKQKNECIPVSAGGGLSEPDARARARPAPLLARRARKTRTTARRNGDAPTAGYFTPSGGFKYFARNRYTSPRDSFANFESIRLNSWPPGASL